ncbi:hypothetical protein AAVH_07473 [Aphelenchoides avenae]|nr:hypothetical protein AAVH_07473 [Aphelenchus avenae]
MRVAALLLAVIVLLVVVCADESPTSSDVAGATQDQDDSTTYASETTPTISNGGGGDGNETGKNPDEPFPLWAIIVVVLGLIISFLIAVIVAVLWRRRMLPCCKDEQETTPAKNSRSFLSHTPFSKTPETRIYLEPDHFEHKGPLEVKSETPLDLKPQINKEDEKVVAPPNAHFKFAEEPGAHVVYDIGSDVEQVQ